MAAPRLELESVSKVYGAGRPEEVRALTDVSLTVAPGEFLSVEGPSGCGKTTLLNLLGLLDVPTRGEIRWDARSLADRTDRERSRLRLTGVGFIFQRFYLLPSLTARENVELPMRALGRPAVERRERAHTLLEETGLANRAEAFPHQLSGGEEQRVAIARALANQPGLLLADEPTGELDSANSQVILNLLTEAHERTGATVILVTHNPLVSVRAHRHLVMKDGKVVSDQTTA
ncbi:MAG: ABC transporter ATP-binding protein [Thermoplasmata archaeon]